jgi:hypothetical protein
LVSADFLASDFVVNNELPPLLDRAGNGGLLIVPLIVGPRLFSEHDELSRYQSVNSPDRPPVSGTFIPYEKGRLFF